MTLFTGPPLLGRAATARASLLRAVAQLTRSKACTEEPTSASSASGSCSACTSAWFSCRGLRDDTSPPPPPAPAAAFPPPPLLLLLLLLPTCSLRCWWWLLSAEKATACERERGAADRGEGRLRLLKQRQQQQRQYS